MKYNSLRSVQIDLVTDTPNDIVTWFEDLWSELHMVNVNVYGNSGREFILYTIDGENIPLFYINTGEFWCDFKNYWNIMETRFNLDYAEISNITKLLVERTITCDIGFPDVMEMKSEVIDIQKIGKPIKANLIHKILIKSILNNYSS